MNNWSFRTDATPWTLAGNEVHVYRLTLNSRGSQTPATYLLSFDERVRADRLKIPSKRHEFILVRSTLRRVISAYLDVRPEAVAFSVSPHGKPELLTPQLELRFNVSHSRGLALIAVGKQNQLGVDIEQHRDKVDYMKVSRRFFSSEERKALGMLPPQQQKVAFFRCWSQKEAIVKANGRGIALGLDKFDVSLHPNATPRLLATRWAADETPPRALFNLDVGPGYSAALAVDSDNPCILTWSIET